MSDRKPRAPTGLDPAGRTLWRRVTGEFALRGDELAVFEHAARTLDELARLQDALADAPVTVAGSTGQVRAHPLFAEIRQHRATLKTLLGALKVEADGVEDMAVRPAMSNAERSARMRWRASRIEERAKREQGHGA